jgi:hypothetical protein
MFHYRVLSNPYLLTIHEPLLISLTHRSPVLDGQSILYKELGSVNECK